jgi:hypothetical protein
MALSRATLRGLSGADGVRLDAMHSRYLASGSP